MIYIVGTFPVISTQHNSNESSSRDGFICVQGWGNAVDCKLCIKSLQLNFLTGLLVRTKLTLAVLNLFLAFIQLRILPYDP